MPALFVSATGTGVGKTFVGRGLARALLNRDFAVAALKPIETGCEPFAQDARALSLACGRPEVASVAGFWRAEAPLAPIALDAEVRETQDFAALVTATQGQIVPGAWTLVEGAGGVAVPIDAQHDMMDLAKRLDLPMLVVARDGLGVLSYVRTALHYARSREVEVLACVLSRFGQSELSHQTNAEVLRSLTDVPIFVTRSTSDDDEQLAAEVIRSGLVAYLVDRLVP